MAGYTSKRLSLPLHENTPPFSRVDLEFAGLRHRGPSYEGRVFLNADNPTLRTPRELAYGYAGSLYIFGHDHCWGDEGHCEVPPGPLHGYDSRRPHQLEPQRHVLDVTEAVRSLTEGRARTVAVSVLPIVRRRGKPRVDHSVFQFERLSLITYDPATWEAA